MACDQMPRPRQARSARSHVSETPELSVSDLRVRVSGTEVDIITEVSFELASREALGIVGESGCGKTTVAMALLGYARPGTEIAGGHVIVNDQDVLALTGRRLAQIRGRGVSYVPQNPSRALSPGMRVGDQLREMFKAHPVGGDPEALVRSAWEGAQLPFARDILDRYPHQLSGGQQQRVAIAMALVCEPSVIVMDEPTTGLDVVTQARLLDVIAELSDHRDVSIVYVSHDLGVVRNVVDRVAVMYGGRIVEAGPVNDLFRAPAHPYTRRLLEAIPRAHVDTGELRGISGTAVEPWDRPAGCPFAPRCELRVERCESAMPPSASVNSSGSWEVRCWRYDDIDAKTGPVRRRPPEAASSEDETELLGVSDLVAGYKRRRHLIGTSQDPGFALRGVSFAATPGVCLAIVGESGSGKTTLGRCLAGLHKPSSGEVRFLGQPIAPLARDRPPDLRRRIQLVFQDPDSSLNPMMTVGAIIRRPLRQFFDLGRGDETVRIDELLAKVHLPAGIRARKPRELSGGEKQRVAIARALAADPELLICDEVTSALDVAVQASILELLNELRRDRALAMLFISHDLAVVRTISDRVLVLQAGQIVELADRAQLFNKPAAPYTRELLDSVHDLHPGDYPRWETAPVATAGGRGANPQAEESQR